MATKACDFIWYELMTSDVAAASDFYGRVVGWTMAETPAAGRAYTLACAGERQVGGVMALPEEARKEGARPAWFGYVAVPDVDAAVEAVKQAGGSVHRAAQDIPGVGRFAVVADPQGAGFMLFRGEGAAPAPVAPGTPGHIGWHELHARDQEDAFAFYGKLFGWTKGDAVDMGTMGAYQLFSTGADPIGGMMSNAQAPHPFWLFYITVEDIDAAAARVTQAGGTIAHGPAQVPGGSWIVMGNDPQGATFALTGRSAAGQ